MDKDSLIQNLISSIIPVLLGFLIGYFSSVQPDFGISVNPIAVTIPIGTSTTANITVFDIHDFWLHNYKNQIVLTSTTLTNCRYSSDLNITFDRVGFDPLTDRFPFMSNMTVHASRNAKPGEYRIDILSIGGEGKEKKCIFLLKLKNTVDSVLSPRLLEAQRT